MGKMFILESSGEGSWVTVDSLCQLSTEAVQVFDFGLATWPGLGLMHRKAIRILYFRWNVRKSLVILAKLAPAAD